MKYVIHSTIIFDTIEYTLISVRNPHVSAKLSNSAGRVLEELVKYHSMNTLVTRDHLFSVVWKAYGLAPSNGNLNQQISLIRKIFTNFGLNGSFIITIPKKGLQLNSQLIIEKIKNKATHTTILSTEITNHKHNANTPFPTITNNFKLHIKNIIILITMMFFILFMGLIYFHIRHNNVKLYCCKEIDSCNICTFNTIPELEYNNDCIQHFEII